LISICLFQESDKVAVYSKQSTVTVLTPTPAQAVQSDADVTTAKVNALIARLSL
jgi:hypothetical protein